MEIIKNYDIIKKNDDEILKKNYEDIENYDDNEITKS